MQITQEPTEIKLFRIDDVSREIRTKKATIREWEQQWHLRDTHLEAVEKFYTENDIAFFKRFKRLIVDEKVMPELALKQLPFVRIPTVKPSSRITNNENEVEDEEENEPLEIELEVDTEFSPAHRPVSADQTAKTITISIEELNKIRNQLQKIKEILS